MRIRRGRKSLEYELDERARVVRQDKRGKERGSDGRSQGACICRWHASKGSQVDVERRLRRIFCRQAGFDGPRDRGERGSFACCKRWSACDRS